MLNIVIFGGPGSGKGTQSDKLIEHYGLFHISTGEVLRDNIKRGTELGKIAKGLIDNGQLVPDEVMTDILANVLDNNKEQTCNGVIFDGFPRTMPQAYALDKMLADRGTAISAVIGLEVPEDELVRRIVLRGQISGRADDNEETARKRIEVFRRQTEPLKEFYEQKGIYHEIDGHGSIDDIFELIKQALD